MPVRYVSGSLGKKGLTKRKSHVKTIGNDDIERTLAKKCTWKNKLQPLWTRQLITEEFSRRRASKYNHASHEEEVKNAIRGPGYYNVPRQTFKESSMPQNKGFTTGQRSSIIISDKSPPPGRYFPNIFKNSSVVKKSLSKSPTFEWTPPDRFKPKVDLSWKLPPTVYSPRYTTGIEALLRKQVSTKGPYQPFTGPRDNTTIKNHYCRERCAPDKFYDVGTSLDHLLKHPRRRQCGVLYRKKTYSVKDFFHDRRTRDISRKIKPAESIAYDVSLQGTKTVQPKKVAFNSSEHISCTSSSIFPGPGRYFMTPPPRYSKKGKKAKPLPQVKNVQVAQVADKITTALKMKQNAENLDRLARLLLDEELPIPTIYEVVAKENEYLHPRSKILFGKCSLLKDKLYQHYPTPKVATERLQYHSWHVVPTLVQSVLLEHPAVKEVIVVGFPSEMSDNNPFALVTLRSGFNVTTHDLLEYVNYKLFFRENIKGGLKIITERSLMRTASGRPTESSIALALTATHR